MVLFQAPGFPSVDAPVTTAGILSAALKGLPVDVVASQTLETLKDGTRAVRGDVLVLPHGSAYPLAGWPAIRSFLRAGGNLVVLGGAPFHRPVWAAPAGRSREPAWTTGLADATAAREFLIGPAEEIAMPQNARVAVLPEADLSGDFPQPAKTWAMTVRLGTEAEYRGEGGSESKREAVARPLVHVLDADGVPRGCPLFEVDRLLGSSAGGRWIFAPADVSLPAPIIRAIVERALEGAGELRVVPVLATVEPGEKPAIKIAYVKPRRKSDADSPSDVLLVVRDPGGKEILARTVHLAGAPSAQEATVELDVPRLAPGLHTVEAGFSARLSSSTLRHPSHATSGFWVRDAKLIRPGPKITVSRDWLRRNGKAFPVVGTTYMSSLAQRNFLFSPNPYVWDRDFAGMNRLGVNFVRTGFWFGWQRMLDEAGGKPGVPSEAVLRALEAYVHAAARHDIVVSFNFFAFQPPAYGGKNPYLDPVSLAGQKALLGAFAARFKGVGWIHWDLINEPSYGGAAWANVPNRDEYEVAAWRAWVKRHHGDDVPALRNSWRELRDDVFELPTPGDLKYSYSRGQRHPRKAVDFVRFTNEVGRDWAATLRAHLREKGGGALVTLGQDEGGVTTRPSQQLHYGAVDYTSTHTWWNNDDLLWDGVLSKVPEKPSLIQETGMMRLEDTDGLPWRTPEAAASMLERKFAYAFAARGAGAVEWAWNINPYNPIDLEPVIGIFRPDGTAKPELRAITEYARFFRQAAPFLDDYDADEVVIVIPHSRIFAGRMGGLDAVKTVIRVAAEELGVVPGAISELALTPVRLAGAKAIIVPSPEMLDDKAAAVLLAVSRKGTKVLITGAVEGDPYGNATPSLKELGVLKPHAPVAVRESTHWPREGAWATFDGAKQQEWLRRALGPEPTDFSAAVVHEPLPLEFAKEHAALSGLLDAFLKAAGVATYESDVRVATRVLPGVRSTLVVCVNESSGDAVRRVKIAGRALDVPVLAGRSRLVLIDPRTGNVLAASSGPAVAPVPVAAAP